jgi:hypothetical protein
MKSLAISLLAAALILSAAAQNSSITTFSVPGAVSTVPVSINATGVIAGEYFDSRHFPHGFVRTQQGVITAFDAFGATAQQTTVQGINKSGTILGGFAHCLVPSCHQGTGDVYYIYTRSTVGKFTQLTLCDPATIPIPVGINDSGEIAGWCNSGAFTWQNGVQMFFAVPGDNSYTVPTAINNSGQIAGYWGNTAGVRAQGFFRDAFGNITTFTVPNSSETWPYSINTAGEISGYSLDSAGKATGFLYATDGTITTFNLPVNTIYPPKLNDSGEVAGGLTNTKGQTLAYSRSASGQVQEFQVSGEFSAVTAINNIGELAGFYEVNGEPVGFVLH